MDFVRCLYPQGTAGMDWQSIREEEYYDDKYGILTTYPVAGGHTLFVTHGSYYGTVSHEQEIAAEYESGDRVVCCYPKRVAATHPGWDVVMSDADGIVHCDVSIYDDGEHLVVDYGVFSEDSWAIVDKKVP